MNGSVAATVGSVDSATQILGDKWTPRLLKHFICSGSVRFCQLQDLAGGINPRTLSARLASLEYEGIIEKLNPETVRCEYRLTDKGRDLLPVLQAMESWSQKYPNT